MSNGSRRSIAGIGLALTLTLFATPAASAASAASARPSLRAVRTASPAAGHDLLSALWSYLVGKNPFVPKPTQGPTVDPNGIS